MWGCDDCMLTRTCMYVYMWKSHFSIRSLLPCFPIWSFETESPTVPGPHEFGWTCQPESWRLLISDLTWILGLQSHQQLHGWQLFEFKSSCLHGKHFTNWASSPTQLCVWFFRFCYFFATWLKPRHNWEGGNSTEVLWGISFIRLGCGHFIVNFLD